MIAQANSVAWVSSNIEGSYKRGVTLAIAIGWGNVNGAVTSNVYRTNDAPWYSLGHGIVLGYIAIGFFSSVFFLFALRWENVRRDRGDRDEVIGDASYRPSAQEQKLENENGRYRTVDEARRDKGDQWSGFRYSL